VSALDRFRASLVLDHEKWHDGIGYDLDAIRAATPEEREAIEALLLGAGAQGWREVEALAFLDTPRAREALRAAVRAGSKEVRVAVARHAPGVVDEAERAEALVAALSGEALTPAASQALDEAAGFHPPEVVDAVLRAAARGGGTLAVNAAGLALYLHGKAEEPFDWAERPFLLRFAEVEDRPAAFRELCARIGADPRAYLD